MRRSARAFGYGIAAQACSAATNFGLVVLGARVLGPSGLGTLLVGLAAYMLLLGFLRALVTEPLIASSTRLEAPERALTARAAVTLALVSSFIAALPIAVVGGLTLGGLGEGMLLFAPWLVPALVQDMGRSIVFRDRTGASTVLSDLTWLVVMVMLAPLALRSERPWVIVACWGAGSLAGAAVALVQITWRPMPVLRAFDWWRLKAWPFARWLGMQNLVYSVVSYVTVLSLAMILGAADYGGFRAVLSVFAPLTLLGPALALSGLPLVARVVSEDRGRALKVAAELAGLITAITAAYVGVLYAFSGILVRLFGADFAGFEQLIVPIGIGQILAAPAFGLTLFLKAEQRGRTLLWIGTLNAVVYLVLTVVLAYAYGVDGAAWGAVGTGVASVLVLIWVFRDRARGS